MSDTSEPSQDIQPPADREPGGAAVPAAPVAAGERVIMWDVLRGVAVLGVLLANMPPMSLGGMQTMAELNAVGRDPGALDYFAFWFVRVLADTKFITIFSILFGAGLALMSERAKERGTPFLPIYLRRLAALAVFGAGHYILLWFGDILFHYALIGFVAVWFRNVRLRVLVWLAVGFLLLGTLLLAGINLALLARPEAEIQEMAEHGEHAIRIYREGELGPMVRVRAAEFPGWTVFMVAVFGVRTLGLFLCGIALVRSGIFRAPEEHLHVYRRFVNIGLPLGLLATVLLVWPGVEITTVAEGLPFAVGFATCSFLSLAYIAAVMFWCRGNVLTGLRDRFAAVGRMAFTNYIMHSVFAAIIFNYGHQFDQWERFDGLLLTFAIIAFQLWYSPLWLRRFRFGPLEWLWRSITYLRPQPMLRTA